MTDLTLDAPNALTNIARFGGTSIEPGDLLGVELAEHCRAEPGDVVFGCRPTDDDETLWVFGEHDQYADVSAVVVEITKRRR